MTKKRMTDAELARVVGGKSAPAASVAIPSKQSVYSKLGMCGCGQHGY